MQRRRTLWLAVGVPLTVLAGWFAFAWITYPSDRTPEGAYLRVMSAVNEGAPRQLFAYTEQASQDACYTIARSRARAREDALRAFPESERSHLSWARADAATLDAEDVFASYAERFHWLERLRRDLSGVESVTVHGERATVETARGTRYAFRRRPNGIWGLTMFSARLAADAEKASRDAALIHKSAEDYDRARERGKPR